MERVSRSRRSWADEVEADEEAARSLARAALQQLPPLAAAAHVAYSSGPVSSTPGRSRSSCRLVAPVTGCASLTEASADVSDTDTFSPARDRGKSVRSPRKHRGHCRRRPASGFMVDARREVPRAPPPPPRRLASIVVHPTHMSTKPNSEGFMEVYSRRRWRRAAPPVSRPVPADLVGKCFNCFAEDHVRADCTATAKCFNCRQAGHHACDCMIPPARARGPGQAWSLPAQGRCCGARALSALCIPSCSRRLTH